MTVINRRNAVAGWAVWQLTKAGLRRKAEPPPLYKRVARRPEAAAVLVAALGVGVAAYLRLRQSDGE